MRIDFPRETKGIKGYLRLSNPMPLLLSLRNSNQEMSHEGLDSKYCKLSRPLASVTLLLDLPLKNV